MRLDDAIGFLINTTARDLILLLGNEFSSYGITSEQWTILKRLEEEDGISTKELVSRVHKDQGNVTRILELLTNKGLVKKVPNPQDGRSSLIYLTEEGKDMTESLMPIDEKVQNIALNGITTKELEQFKEILRKIDSNVQNELK